MKNYCLTQSDVDQINDQRARSEGKLLGNAVHVGETYPLIISREWPAETCPPLGAVNGQVILDGNDTLWVTSVRPNPAQGDPVPGQFQ